MELTFITIHDLTHEARVLFASLSISDVLGWIPEEVAGKSGFEFFHPEEAPFARSVYGRGVQLDRAAVLHYCSLRARDGSWVSCECAFTIVYNVMVVSVSVYRRGRKSHQRAIDAPTVRRLFASSPRDPRYHMLAHLSTKFTIPSVSAINEPRAALILNRFTRTLSILYATDAVATILGVPANQLSGTSFYECIQEDCLQDAINCLERAKQNDSIAYLRFWFRDPRFAGRSRSHSIDSYDAKQGMDTHMDVDGDSPDGSDESTPTSLHPTDIDLHPTEFSSLNPQGPRLPPLASSPDAAYPGPLPDGPEADDSPITAGPRQNSEESLFDRPPTLISDPSSEPSSVSAGDESHTLPAPSIELEAVISCTSDGLVVVIRKAKAVMQTTFRRPALHPYAHGLFASPWATSPLLPPPTIFNQGFNPGLASSDMMKSIEECACFAWSLGTVNGSLLDYASGRPSGEAAPLVLNVWDPINGMPGQHVPSIRPEDNERDMNGHGSPPPPPPPPTSHGSAYNPTRPEAIPPFNTEVRGPLQPLQPTVHKEIQYRHPGANRTPHNPSASQNILWSSLNGYADAAQQAAPPSQLCPDQNSNGHYAPNAARTATITHVDRAQDVEMVD